MFAYNKYKMHEIEKMDDDVMTAVYRWGKYVDIADGPLICNTSAIKAFKIVKVRTIQYPQTLVPFVRHILT